MTGRRLPDPNDVSSPSGSATFPEGESRTDITTTVTAIPAAGVPAVLNGTCARSVTRVVSLLTVTDE